MEYEIEEWFQHPTGEENDLGLVEEDAGETNQHGKNPESVLGREKVSWLGFWTGLVGTEGIGEEGRYAEAVYRAAQIWTPRWKMTRISWMIQKGMRTRFNHGDLRWNLLAVDFGIVVVMVLD